MAQEHRRGNLCHRYTGNFLSNLTSERILKIFFFRLPSYGLTAYEREMSTPPKLIRGVYGTALPIYAQKSDVVYLPHSVLATVTWCAKFQMPSFIRSKGMKEVPGFTKCDSLR